MFGPHIQRSKISVMPVTIVIFNMFKFEPQTCYYVCYNKLQKNIPRVNNKRFSSYPDGNICCYLL